MHKTKEDRSRSNRDDSEYEIISFLAHHPRSTSYKVWKEKRLSPWIRDHALGKRSSLVAKGLVEVVSSEVWRNLPEPRKEYSLTFKGLLQYFTLVPVDLKKGPSDRRKAIEAYKNLHPMFEHWDALENSVKFGGKEFELVTTDAEGSFKHVDTGLDAILLVASSLSYYHSPFVNLPAGVQQMFPLPPPSLEDDFAFQFLGLLASIVADAGVDVEPSHVLHKSLKPFAEKLRMRINGIEGLVNMLGNRPIIKDKLKKRLKTTKKPAQ